MRPTWPGARPRRPLWRLAVGALTLSLLLAAGDTGSAVATAARSSKAAPKPTVYGTLKSLQRSAAAGSEAAQALGADITTYSAALTAVGQLSGTRRAELASVIANVQQIAAAGEFAPSRLPTLFLTLERNTQWWVHERLPAADERVSFPGSHIVWEYYPGQGIEIQWLATFGAANGFYLEGHENTQLRELLNEIIPLATQRAGGITWEYMFHFDGGSPPWTSALTQGTALQALARAWSRLKTPAYLTSAQQALKLFQAPPPEGVRVATPTGATYLEYTYAPHELIINGFIQSLNGLYDYAKLTGDPVGLKLFEEGDADARAALPHYNTGAWSLYDQHSESDLHYHELLIEFLQDLCKRTQEGPPVPASTTATSGTAGASGGTTGASGATTGTTGTSGATGPTTTSAASPIAGDSIYCATATAFTTDLHTPPAIALLTRTLPTGARGGVQLSLSKISDVSLTVSRGGRVVWTNSALVERGKPRLLWVTPASTGTYDVALRATDLAGNSATASGTVKLTRR